MLAYIAIGWISPFALRFVLRAENAKRERGEVVEILDPNGSGENTYTSVHHARIEKGDNWSGFRYNL